MAVDLLGNSQVATSPGGPPFGAALSPAGMRLAPQQVGGMPLAGSVQGMLSPSLGNAAGLPAAPPPPAMAAASEAPPVSTPPPVTPSPIVPPPLSNAGGSPIGQGFVPGRWQQLRAAMMQRQPDMMGQRRPDMMGQRPMFGGNSIVPQAGGWRGGRLGYGG